MKNQSVTIRKAVEVDAQSILDFAKVLFDSTDQVLTTPHEYTISLEDEKNWIDSFNTNPNALILVAELNNSIVGLLTFTANAKRKIAHTGEFGVSVHPNYQGIGIGKQLISELLRWANENDTIEKVYLNVLDTNVSAIALYRKLGFVEEGRSLKAIKQINGNYVDMIQMAIFTK